MRRAFVLVLVGQLLTAFVAGNERVADDFRQPDAKRLPDLWSFTSTCNSYVLRSGDAALVIDPGDGTLVDRLAGLGVRRVEWVLLTDHHRELSQGLDRFDRSVAQLAVPQAERELFEKPTEFRKWFPKLGDKYSVYGASYARPPRQSVAVQRGLEPGATFEWRGYRLECHATPGHSPGGMTYVLRRDGRAFAFTGGLIYDGARLTRWYDTEWDYGFAKGLDTLLESVDRLGEQRLDVGLPAHGPVLGELSAQLAAYREKLKRFRQSYIRGYPVFDKAEKNRDPISQPTAVPHINRVTPHLYKLSHKTQGKNFAILVSDRGRGLVLDCGLFPEAMLDEIILGMRQHLGLKQIDAFWISHMHGDHFLLGPVMKQKYGAQAWTLDRIVDRCENPRRYDYAALVSAYSDGFDGMKIDKAFRDGETVEWEGYTIHVDWMPGQTEFGCCLWLEVDGKRIAFTGDNLFGSPADETQNGHEAVVARNSAIFEEGYLYGSRYLLNLKPDIVMGSHSYVMPEPRRFLERYHEWSQEIIRLYKELLPDADYEYLYDPYWVSAYPYRVDARSGTAPVTVTIRNFRSTPQRHRVVLKLPPGVAVKDGNVKEGAMLEGTVPPKSRASFPLQLQVDRAAVPAGVLIVPFDITLDGKRYGELFDFLIRGRDE